MAILLRHPTAGGPTTTVTLNPAACTIARKSRMPIQQIEIAVSGREWVRELSTNIEEIWELDIIQLAEADDVTYVGDDGWTTLRSFIETTLDYHANTFDLTDDDGVTLSCRYLRGLQQITEVRKGRYAGTLVFRKTL